MHDTNECTAERSYHELNNPLCNTSKTNLPRAQLLQQYRQGSIWISVKTYLARDYRTRKICVICGAIKIMSRARIASQADFIANIFEATEMLPIQQMKREFLMRI